MAKFDDTFSSNSAYTLYLEVTLDSQSISGNTSTVDWKLYTIKTSGTGFSSSDLGSGSASVNGSVWSDSSFGYNFTGSTPKTVVHASGSKVIAHGSDGRKTINVSASVSLGSLGTASISDTVTLPRIAQAPDAPSTPTVSNVAPTSAKISWSAPSDNGGASISSYQVQRATNSSFTSGVVTTTMSSGGTLSSLAQRDQYWVRVRAVNSAGAGAWSGSASFTTTGHPTAPTGLTATASGGVTGRIALSWTAPSSTGTGGIVGYNIFRNGSQIATTTGTGTSYTDNGLTPYTPYTYTVAARNAYSNSVDGMGPQSSSAGTTAPGPPSAPQNLTAVSGSNVGEVDLSWNVPANAGAGGITGYNIRYANGTLVVATTGTGTTRTITGLTPGVTYTFKVHARNALADTEGSESAASNQALITPVGEPAAPTGLTVTPSTAVSNRLILSWTSPGGSLSGYSIFQDIGGVFTLIGKITSNHTTFTVDNLTAGSTYAFQVRARTVYTDTLSDGYPGNWGGPPSATATGTASANNVQTVASLVAVTSATNAVFNGTYVINQVTATTLRYARTAANIASASSGGSISNSTNAVFNGTYTISATTSTRFSYAKTASNIALILTSGGTVTDNTNIGFNGTFTVTAVNVGANLVSYANTGSNFGPAAVPVNTPPGKTNLVTNLSNAIFNGGGRVITGITEYTLSYAQTNANVAESNAAGAVTNTTNRDTFNGTYVITNIPAYNIVEYAKTASNIATRTWFEPNGLVSRALSPATLDVRFRSGWAG